MKKFVIVNKTINKFLLFVKDAEINNNPVQTIELYATRQNIKDMQTAIKI